MQKITSQDYDLNRELISNLQRGFLGQKFLYMEGGGNKFYQVVNQESYVKKPLEDEALGTFIKKYLDPELPTTLTSLGCGNGSKEVKIFQALKDEYNVKLIAVDSSPELLEEAKRNLEAHSVDGLLIEEDVTRYECAKQIKLHSMDSKQRVIAFLGFTIGNTAQVESANTLTRLLQHGDFLWFDCQLLPGDQPIDKLPAFESVERIMKNNAHVAHLINRFEHLGISKDDLEVTIGTSDEEYTGTYVCTVYFVTKRRIEIENAGIKEIFPEGYKIKVQQYRYYDPKKLVQFYSAYDLELVAEDVRERVGQFLFKKVK